MRCGGWRPLNNEAQIEELTLTADDAASRAAVEAELQTAEQKACALAKTLESECAAIASSAQERLETVMQLHARHVDEIHADAVRDLASVMARTEDLRAKIANLRRGV